MIDSIASEMSFLHRHFQKNQFSGSNVFFLIFLNYNKMNKYITQEYERHRQKMEDFETSKRANEVNRHLSRAATHQSSITGYLPDELDFSPANMARKQREQREHMRAREHERALHKQEIINAERAAEAAEKVMLEYENSFPGTVARVLRHFLKRPLKQQELEALDSDDEEMRFKFASRKRSHVRLASRKRSHVRLAARKRSHVRLASRKRSPAKLKLAARKRSHKRSHARLSFCKAY
jgi:hypothetical protein